MGEVICTLIYRENNHLDLVLPDHIPVNQLVESITTALRIPKEPQTYYDLLTNEEDRLVKLPQCSSLRQSYILNGSILHLVKVKYEKPLNGYLVYQNCTRFHLLENSIIGRSTRDLLVDIDLGVLDVFQVVSRRHAVITYLENSYVINDNSSHNGTFLNEEQILAGRLVSLHAGDKICFGSLEKGVHLNFEISQ